MSRQSSWQCLSVQEFFSLCNWQGQALENSNWQHQNQPLNLSLCQCLSVQEFFSLCNWQGQALENSNWQYQNQSLILSLQAAEATIASRLDSWQCLSVQEFFSLCNWQGQPLDNSNWHPTNQWSRLTLQVGKFFRFIPWEGNPQIGSLPQVSPIPEPTTLAPVATTLTDLSDLF
jgi:hypothetical protein